MYRYKIDFFCQIIATHHASDERGALVVPDCHCFDQQSSLPPPDSVLSAIDVNDCEERNCSGRGDCQDGINEYICTCDTIEGYPRYTGKDCEIGNLFKENKLFIDSAVP